jgi:hypothetical protein
MLFASERQTTERYLGCKQNLGHPMNDRFHLNTLVSPQQAHSESGAVKGPLLYRWHLAKE